MTETEDIIMIIDFWNTARDKIFKQNFISKTYVNLPGQKSKEPVVLEY